MVGGRDPAGDFLTAVLEFDASTEAFSVRSEVMVDKRAAFGAVLVDKAILNCST